MGKNHDPVMREKLEPALTHLANLQKFAAEIPKQPLNRACINMHEVSAELITLGLMIFEAIEVKEKEV